jgi:glycosyltransferase involved in cell wall biosynthesis
MDICVAPHLKESNQASPVKIFDYMACGQPIVASDIEVVREIVGDSKCASLVVPEMPKEMAEGIVELAEYPEKRKLMGATGRTLVVKRFDRLIMARDLMNRFSEGDAEVGGIV